MSNIVQDKQEVQTNQATSTRRRVFEDFSVAQIIASVLSTITSALLSSKIGLIGGLVGAAIGAAVAASAYQLFRGLLNASADKIREVAPDWVDAGTPNISSSSIAGTTTPASTAEIVQSGGRVAPDYYRHMQSEHTRKRRLTIVVTSIAALLAVAITAFVIDALSAGQGLGERISLVPSLQNEQPTTAGSHANEKPNADNRASSTAEAGNDNAASTHKDAQSANANTNTADNTTLDNTTESNSSSSASSSSNANTSTHTDTLATGESADSSISSDLSSSPESDSKTEVNNTSNTGAHAGSN
ncbi:hypothetical protein [Atopobium fossor]|uniref:hypothetical protein n=1 Tax=Atopobium fossor TaxID=39487 RepID=UPI0004285843|nr:hypothetical protein [Atopobium fossor]